jgi:hypothetical protein
MEIAPPPAPQSNFPTILGVICLAIGLLTFWVFGLGFLFLVGALGIAITALIKTQAKQGLLLLVFSAASLPVCAILFVFLFPVLTMFGAMSYQQKRITNFMNPSIPAPHRPFFIGKEHTFATRTMTSPDGGTFLVIDDSNVVCNSILIDGKPWQHDLRTPGEIEPGRHTITCDGGTHPFDFTVDQGKTLSVTSWRP